MGQCWVVIYNYTVVFVCKYSLLYCGAYDHINNNKHHICLCTYGIGKHIIINCYNKKNIYILYLVFKPFNFTKLSVSEVLNAIFKFTIITRDGPIIILWSKINLVPEQDIPKKKKSNWPKSAYFCVVIVYTEITHPLPVMSYDIFSSRGVRNNGLIILRYK